MQLFTNAEARKLCRAAHEAHEECDGGHDQEADEQNLRDARRTCSDATKTE